MSALFAGLTALLAKKGVEGIPSNLALFLRVIVITIFAGSVAVATKQTSITGLGRTTWIFLILSGLATGCSWLCYFKALQLGPVSRVAPIDKLSFVLAMALGIFVLKESPTPKVLLGAALIVVGVLLTL